MSNQTISSAMLLTSFFFVQRSFLNYDRFKVGTASLFLASKMFNESIRIDHFIFAHHKAYSTVMGGAGLVSISDEEKHQLIKNITRLESLLMKTMLDHCGRIFGNDLAYCHAKKYL